MYIFLVLTFLTLFQIVSTGVVLRTTSSWLHAVSVKVKTTAQLLALQELHFISKMVCVAKQKSENREFLTEEDTSHVTFGKLPLCCYLPSADKRRQDNPEPEFAEYGFSAEALLALSVPEAHKKGYTGEGVLIMVVDSGFSLDHRGIPKVQIINQYDFVDGKTVFLSRLNISSGDNDTTGDDAQMKHGTATLSLIVGRDPGRKRIFI